MTDEIQDAQKKDLIKENLRRAFDDKATEDLPADLVALLAKLKEQDAQNGTD